MTSLRATLVLFFALCTMGVYGYYFGSIPSLKKLNEQALMHVPDLNIHAFKLLEFNEQGELSKHVVSDHVTHIPHQNQYILHEPHIQFRSKEATYYYLVANEASTLEGFEKMIFNGHVVLDQPQTKDLQAFNMQTESLTYLPKKEQAFTHDLVQFKQVGHIVHAYGMRANLKTNHIMLHDAKAKLHPAHA